MKQTYKIKCYFNINKLIGITWLTHIHLYHTPRQLHTPSPPVADGLASRIAHRDREDSDEHSWDVDEVSSGTFTIATTLSFWMWSFREPHSSKCSSISCPSWSRWARSQFHKYLCSTELLIDKLRLSTPAVPARTGHSHLRSDYLAHTEIPGSSHGTIAPRPGKDLTCSILVWRVVVTKSSQLNSLVLKLENVYVFPNTTWDSHNCSRVFPLPSSMITLCVSTCLPCSSVPAFKCTMRPVTSPIWSNINN